MPYTKSTIQFGEKVAYLDTFWIIDRKKGDCTAGDSPENTVSISYSVESALRRLRLPIAAKPFYYTFTPNTQSGTSLSGTVSLPSPTRLSTR